MHGAGLYLPWPSPVYHLSLCNLHWGWQQDITLGSIARFSENICCCHLQLYQCSSTMQKSLHQGDSTPALFFIEDL